MTKCGGSWGPIWHLGGSLMSLPVLPPPLPAPGYSTDRESVIYHVRGKLRSFSCPGRRKLCILHTSLQKTTVIHALAFIVKACTPVLFQATILQLDLCLHWNLSGVYGSFYLCLCSHSPCLSYIPKEAITSLASASPWAVVIVTCGPVDMTTPPWSRDKW